MKAKKNGGAGSSTSQLSLDFNRSANAQKVTRAVETRGSAQIVGLAQFRSAKIRDLLIADLLSSRVPK
jgi:hypothetical protein